MTPYGRRLVGGLMAGPMILFGLFAWSLVSAPSAPEEVPIVIEAVGSSGPDDRSTAGAADDAVDATVERARKLTSEVVTDGLRPLPRARGLPDPVAEAVGPVGIRIADIGVDGDVVPVGVEADGSLEVPEVSEVGWYRFGSNAGDPGSTVVAAHIAYDGVDGIFRHLSSVSPGAKVELDMADGAVVEYRVTEVVQYDKTDLPVADLFSESGGDRLVLITCGGTFNPRLRSYDSNVVVHAVPTTG